MVYTVEEILAIYELYGNIEKYEQSRQQGLGVPAKSAVEIEAAKTGTAYQQALVLSRTRGLLKCQTLGLLTADEVHAAISDLFVREKELKAEK